MTIAYLCGENSIWKMTDMNLLRQSLEEENEDKELVRIIRENPQIRGKYMVKYEIISRESFLQMQLAGEDVLVYFKEDIRAQLRRLEKTQNKILTFNPENAKLDI